MDVGTYRDRLKALNVDKLISDTLKEFEPIFIDANISQLEKGKREDGTQIGKYSNGTYAAEKYSMNPLAGMGNVDLILTGEFSKGITIAFTPDKMVFDSTGKNKDSGIDLLDEWGDNVLGLSDTAIKENQTDFQTVLIDKYYKEIGK